VARTLITEAAGGNLQAARLLLLWVLGKPDDPVHPDGIARLVAAEARADRLSPSLPAEREAHLDTDLHSELERLADPEARLNVAARALAAEMRVLRGAMPDPGAIVGPALKDRD
jgi:hypothetical protein